MYLKGRQQCYLVPISDWDYQTFYECEPHECPNCYHSNVHIRVTILHCALQNTGRKVISNSVALKCVMAHNRVTRCCSVFWRHYCLSDGHNKVRNLRPLLTGHGDWLHFIKPTRHIREWLIDVSTHFLVAQSDSRLRRPQKPPVRLVQLINCGRS